MKSQFQFVEFKKFNMKCEIERMEIIYTFYFFIFLKKVIKKLLTFCYKLKDFVYPAYSARTAHPFQRNGAPFRFKLSKAQQVD